MVSGYKDSRFELLFDPQTSGGLLMGVAQENSAGLCASLIDAGYVHATVIGELSTISEDDGANIIVV